MFHVYLAVSKSRINVGQYLLGLPVGNDWWSIFTGAPSREWLVVSGQYLLGQPVGDGWWSIFTGAPSGTWCVVSVSIY